MEISTQWTLRASHLTESPLRRDFAQLALYTNFIENMAASVRQGLEQAGLKVLECTANPPQNLGFGTQPATLQVTIDADVPEPTPRDRLFARIGFKNAVQRKAERMADIDHLLSSTIEEALPGICLSSL